MNNITFNVYIGYSSKKIVVDKLFTLDGMILVAADENQLQTRILNLSKGPLVRTLKTQVDKITYPKWIISNKRIRRVVLNCDKQLKSRQVTI